MTLHRSTRRRPPPAWSTPEHDDWRGEALCREVDPDLFFPEKGGDIRPAKKVCGMCSVTAECLAEILQQPDADGIWGGTSRNDRVKIRQRAAADSAVAA